MPCVQDVVYKHWKRGRICRIWKDIESKHKYKHSKSKIRGQDVHKGNLRINENKFSFSLRHSSSTEYFA